MTNGFRLTVTDDHFLPYILIKLFPAEFRERFSSWNAKPLTRKAANRCKRYIDNQC